MADDHQQQRLKRTFEALRQALEDAESALIEYEETLGRDSSSTVRPQSRTGLELLSIPEVCQELGMGKSWVYQRYRPGRIPIRTSAPGRTGIRSSFYETHCPIST